MAPDETGANRILRSVCVALDPDKRNLDSPWAARSPSSEPGAHTNREHAPQRARVDGIIPRHADAVVAADRERVVLRRLLVEQIRGVQEDLRVAELRTTTFASTVANESTGSPPPPFGKPFTRVSCTAAVPLQFL